MSNYVLIKLSRVDCVELKFNNTVPYWSGRSKMTAYDKKGGKAGLPSLSVANTHRTTYCYNRKRFFFPVMYMRSYEVFQNLRKKLFFLTQLEPSSSDVRLNTLKLCKNTSIFRVGLCIWETNKNCLNTSKTCFNGFEWEWNGNIDGASPFRISAFWMKRWWSGGIRFMPYNGPYICSVLL